MLLKEALEFKIYCENLDRNFYIFKMHLKMSSGKWRPSCLVLNVLKNAVEVMAWMSNRIPQKTIDAIINPYHNLI